VFVDLKLTAVANISNGYFYPFYQWVKIPITVPYFRLKGVVSAKKGIFLFFCVFKKTRVFGFFN